MSGQYPAWFGAVAASVTMIFLGIQTRMLTLPVLRERCRACGRLFWRGRGCPCSRA